MDMQGDKGNYRQFVMSKWVSGDIESFRKPSQVDLKNQIKYYSPLINKFIPDKKDIDILEIGCGWGGFIYTLKKMGYSNIDAIDIIPEACLFVEQVCGIKVSCIDVFSFFKNNNKKYDVIVAFDVIEHFNKDEIVSLMNSIYNSLKKGGIFIMHTPNGGSLKGLYIRYSGFTHEIAFTPLSINELFKAVGFSKVFCMPEPEISSNLIKKMIKNSVRKIFAKLYGLDSNYMFSTNIIGVGLNEK